MSTESGNAERYRSNARTRSNILQATRGFFADRGYIEVETPVRIAAPAPEPHIDAEPAGGKYLRTSPELHMKRLMCAGMERIYQIGPCFRKGESGRWHCPEYTMLEWYHAGWDYRDMMDECRDLMRHVCINAVGGGAFTHGGIRIDVQAPWHIVTVAEAFRESAGWNPIADFDPDRFDIDLVEKVVPSFPSDRMTALLDYPVQASALARCRNGGIPVAERWELFAAGMELANIFSELTDCAEQEARFAQWLAERAERGMAAYPVDRLFLGAMASGLPECAGAAMGIDRLVMLLADASSIDEVRMI